MNTNYHKESLADQAAMQIMRAELRLQPALQFGPEARPVFDEIVARTPAAQNVSYEAETVGGVPGWWCKPSDTVKGAAVLYLHGGAYVLGSAIAYRNFAGQIAARAEAAAFIADYRLAPEHHFPGAVEDHRGLSRPFGRGIFEVSVGGRLGWWRSGALSAASCNGSVEDWLGSSTIGSGGDVSLDRSRPCRGQHGDKGQLRSSPDA